MFRFIPLPNNKFAALSKSILAHPASANIPISLQNSRSLEISYKKVCSDPIRPDPSISYLQKIPKKIMES